MSNVLLKSFQNVFVKKKYCFPKRLQDQSDSQPFRLMSGEVICNTVILNLRLNLFYSFCLCLVLILLSHKYNIECNASGA